MALEDDIADDFDLFDFAEVVSLQRRDLAGTVTGTETEIPALRRMIACDPVSGVEGSLTFIDHARWHLKASALVDVPKKGDRIVSADSGTWQISEDDVATLSTRYAVTCRRTALP